MTGRVLYAERQGRGPALMLLHGFTGSGHGLAGLASALAGDCETLRPDLPGHGRSAAVAAIGFEQCVRDLAATLGAAGHRRAHWLGYSMGARLALGCAVQSPDVVSSLVLVGGRAGIADAGERHARRRRDEELARRIETVGIEGFVAEWLAQPLFATLHRRGAGFLEQQRRERMANDAHGLADSLRALGPGAQPPLFDALPGVDVPVLLVAGELDREFVACAEDLARQLPRAEICVIADAGHAAHLEQPERVAAAVRDFLRRADFPASSVHVRPVEETAS